MDLFDLTLAVALRVDGLDGHEQRERDEQEIEDRLQEQAHRQLAASELMYRSVLEGTRIGTWQWNVQTGETLFNQRWAEIVGYTLTELAPISIDTWLKLAHPADLTESAALLQAHFDGLSPFYDVKCRMLHKDGHYVWVHNRGRVISWTDDGKPLMMYGTHADITEQHNNEWTRKWDNRHFFMHRMAVRIFSVSASRATAIRKSSMMTVSRAAWSGALPAPPTRRESSKRFGSRSRA